MSIKDNFKNLKLGLDIGTSSVGWGIIGQNKENDEWEIVDFGVRIWTAPENPKTLNSSANDRRMVRSARRLQNRKRVRIHDLKNYLNRNNFISKQEIEEHFNKLKDKTDYNVTSPKYKNEINPFYLRYQGLSEKLTPLQIAIVLINYSKNRGYNNAFKLFEAEKSSRESIAVSEEMIKKYTYPIKAIMEDSRFKMGNGNLILHNKEGKKYDKENSVKPNFDKDVLWLREDLKNELLQILKIQSKFHPFLNEEHINHLVNKIVFRQRDFEDGPGPLDKVKKEEWKNKLLATNKNSYYAPFIENVGYCQFIEGERRVSNLSLIGDIWTILTTIGSYFSDKNVKDISKKVNNVNFLSDFTRLILENYFKEFKFDKETFEKLLYTFIQKEDIDEIFDTGKPKIEIKDSKLFLKRFLIKGQDELKIFITKSFENFDFTNLENFENNIFSKLGTIFYENKTPTRIISKIEELNLDLSFFNSKESIEKWIAENLKHFTGGQKMFAVSTKHIFNVLQNQLNTNQLIGQYQYQVSEENKRRFLESKKFDKNDFLKKIEDEDMIKNGVVLRSINQTRKIVRQIMKRYDGIENIVIEVAKDIYNEVNVRKQIRSKQDNNEKYNNLINQKLLEFGVIPNAKNAEKLKLFNLQAGKDFAETAIDPYTLYKEQPEWINIRDIFNEDIYEVDHIIPYSFAHDDSLANKVLTKRTYNQSKGQKTAYQWVGEQCNNDKITLKKYSKNVQDNFKGGKHEQKRKNLLTEKVSRSTLFENVTSKINDTRYITSYIFQYFYQEMEKMEVVSGIKMPKITTINGSSTSLLRRNWLSKTPWGIEGKPRDFTPFHHSIDAIIVASSFDKMEIFKAELFLRMQSVYRLLNKNYWFTRAGQKRIEIDNLEERKEFLKKGIESFNKTVARELTIIERYLKKGEEVDRDVVIQEKQKEVIQENVKNVLELMKQHIEEGKHFDITSLEQFKWLTAPLVKNIDEVIERLIPIKLEVVNEDKVIEQVPKKEQDSYNLNDKKIRSKTLKFVKLISPSEWSEENKLSKDMYPYVSYKINKKINSEFANANPISLTKLELKLNANNFIKKEGNNYEKASFWGLRHNQETNKWERYSTFDALNNSKNIKNERVIYNNVSFRVLDENKKPITDYFYTYKGLTGNGALLGILNLHYSKTKFNETFFSDFQRFTVAKQVNTLINNKNIEILNIDTLGKIKGYEYLNFKK